LIETPVAGTVTGVVVAITTADVLDADTVDDAAALVVAFVVTVLAGDA
jgi:hypothetical protein